MKKSVKEMSIEDVKVGQVYQWPGRNSNPETKFEVTEIKSQEVYFAKYNYLCQGDPAFEYFEVMQSNDWILIEEKKETKLGELKNLYKRNRRR